MLEQHVIPFFGDTKIREITPAHITKWQNEMSKKGFSDSYLRMIDNQFRALFTHATKIYDLDNNKKELFEAYVPKEFVFDSLMVRDTMMDWHPSDTVKLKEKQDTLLIDTLKTKKL